jgi:hypothetical protein
MTQTVSAEELLAQLDELDANINNSLATIEEILEDLKTLAPTE